MFGELPAWGLYVRHVENLAMRNIRFSIGEADYRPAMVFDDVRHLDIHQLKIIGEKKPKPIILHHAGKVNVDCEDTIMRL